MQQVDFSDQRLNAAPVMAPPMACLAKHTGPLVAVTMMTKMSTGLRMRLSSFSWYRKDSVGGYVRPRIKRKDSCQDFTRGSDHVILRLGLASCAHTKTLNGNRSTLSHIERHYSSARPTQESVIRS